MRARIAGSSNGVRREPGMLWNSNVVPLVTAAREGAAHAARTAGRERARARARQAWWRRHWAVPAAAGVVLAGIAGGILIGMARRRARAGSPEQSATGAGGLRSTMESGRERVSGTAKTMVNRVRGGNGSGDHSGTGNSAGNGAGSGRSASATGQARAMPSTGGG